MSCFADFAEICQPDAPLAPLTWYKLGGPARWLLGPRGEAELAAVLARCQQQGLPWRILGRGANVLVRDAGVDGAVIRLVGPAWEEVRWDDAVVYAAAGADFHKLVKDSVERGLIGLENLAGIPGTVGGIIRMNAGGKYGNIAQYTRDVRLMDQAGQIMARPAAEVGFSYRHTNLAGFVVLGATFGLQSGEREAAVRHFQSVWKEKSATQAALGERSAGCVFKNPPGEFAGRLVDAAGLKGFSIGGAQISPKHANFVVAREGATAQNVIDLITLARERVRQNTGIELELEVEIW
jgi:UDP-N-acetylmuramate dehydrogenase